MGLLHKSEAGGVVLGVADLPALRAAYRDLAERLAPPAVSVEAMADLAQRRRADRRRAPGPAVRAGRDGGAGRRVHRGARRHRVRARAGSVATAERCCARCAAPRCCWERAAGRRRPDRARGLVAGQRVRRGPPRARRAGDQPGARRGGRGARAGRPRRRVRTRTQEMARTRGDVARATGPDGESVLPFRVDRNRSPGRTSGAQGRPGVEVPEMRRPLVLAGVQRLGDVRPAEGLAHQRVRRGQALLVAARRRPRAAGP